MKRFINERIRGLTSDNPHQREEVMIDEKWVLRRTPQTNSGGLTRRVALQGAAALAIGGVVAPRSSRAASIDFKGKTVVVAVGSFMSSGITMFKEQWEARTGGRIQIVEIPFGDLYQRLFTAFTSGAHQFDVAIYASNWIPEFAQAGHIISLESYYPQKDNWNTV